MDIERVREETQKASTESLLDIVTVYRTEMENIATEVAESELSARGVRSAQIATHATMRQNEGFLRHSDGTVIRCNFCSRPAIEHQWEWQRLWGWFLPLFPRQFHLCHAHTEHRPTDAHGRVLHYEKDQGGQV